MAGDGIVLLNYKIFQAVKTVLDQRIFFYQPELSQSTEDEALAPTTKLSTN